jgi:predicted AAA+ superfamily ATPase
MVTRHFWLRRITEGLQERSVLWLSGVRRVGKTMLCKSLPNIEYFDCELPRVRRIMEDPQSFLEELKGHTLVLDEVHRLANPSEILKIAADHFPSTKIVATGSSTLGASAKFKDTLAGRKYELWLTPMITDDLKDFRQTNLSHRFLHGGLPPFFTARRLPERDFQEWVDAFWAKDVLELFRLEKRHSFLKFAELLMVQSGGIFEASSFAAPCGVSRSTISNYLAVLEATYVVHVVRPFTSHRPTEIVSAPRIYAFDTGFMCYYRGWDKLRQDDMGTLWEHFVLNELLARTQSRKIHYWRDKQKHEVDFVISKNKAAPIVIECKWTSADFDPSNIKIFRGFYPEGLNFVVASDITRSYSRSYDDVTVRFVNIEDLIKELSREYRTSLY